VINYSILSIAEAGQVTSSIPKEDFTTDFTFDGSNTGSLIDGQIRLATPGSKYSTPYRPGTYTVTVEGAIDGVAAPVEGDTKHTFTFSFTLTDPCDPPTSLVADTSDLTYKITATATTITPVAWVITPSYCKFNKNEVINANDLGLTAITEPSDDVFSVFYDADLNLVGKTQTITRTATSYSDYQANTDNEVVSTDTITVTYATPCDDTSLTTITSKS